MFSRFHRSCWLLVVLSSLAPALAGPPPADQDSPAAGKGPQVGEKAPELGLSSWLQKDDSFTGKLSDLAGKVVVVHTFAWNCPTCLKTGIPTAVELREANADRGLVVVSITTPANREETLAVMRKQNLTHPVATENPLGSSSPYVNTLANGITYLFLIGRNGDLIWRGSPSGDLKGFLEASQRALNQPAGRGLIRKLHPVLARAVEAYQEESYEEARRLAEKLSAAGSKSRQSDATTIVQDAAYLTSRIDQIATQLRNDLEEGVKQKDAAKLLAARDTLKRGFAKSERWEKARGLLEEVEGDKELKSRIEVAAEWSELCRQRPPLFPAAADAASKKYAASLKQFLKRRAASEFAERARALLESFEKKG